MKLNNLIVSGIIIFINKYNSAGALSEGFNFKKSCIELSAFRLVLPFFFQKSVNLYSKTLRIMPLSFLNHVRCYLTFSTSNWMSATHYLVIHGSSRTSRPVICTPTDCNLLPAGQTSPQCRQTKSCTVKHQLCKALKHSIDDS
jgi:hypothetical protein